jgi:hypothetical protein
MGQSRRTLTAKTKGIDDDDNGDGADVENNAGSGLTGGGQGSFDRGWAEAGEHYKGQRWERIDRCWIWSTDDEAKRATSRAKTHRFDLENHAETD